MAHDGEILIALRVKCIICMAGFYASGAASFVDVSRGRSAYHRSKAGGHQIDRREPPAHLEGVHVGRDIPTYAAATILPSYKASDSTFGCALLQMQCVAAKWGVCLTHCCGGLSAADGSP